MDYFTASLNLDNATIIELRAGVILSDELLWTIGQAIATEVSQPLLTVTKAVTEDVPDPNA